MALKKLIRKFPFLSRIVKKTLHSYFTFGFQISSKGTISGLKKYISGKNNRLVVGENTLLQNVCIHIVGSNNEIMFGKNCTVLEKNSFWIEGNNAKIVVGDKCSFTQSNHINAQESNSTIYIGDDCMISNNVHIRTSDSHPIFDIQSGKRLNSAKNVYIGRHVWIAPYSAVYKGVHIGEGSIIASHSLVTHDIPENVIAAGLPAKIVKTGIRWSREDVLYHDYP